MDSEGLCVLVIPGPRNKEQSNLMPEQSRKCKTLSLSCQIDARTIWNIYIRFRNNAEAVKSHQNWCGGDAKIIKNDQMRCRVDAETITSKTLERNSIWYHVDSETIKSSSIRCTTNGGAIRKHKNMSWIDARTSNNLFTLNLPNNHSKRVSVMRDRCRNLY